ncbi:hypothetical protein MF628_001957 [Paenibacillus polymyxa]|uniref:hypothetical protein n=1 Tax=Paenibacillus polymyxa TaxID=1406 RepID=UPI0020243316|nr:hypothetical protein [Paenibacillus polymyxa]URJ47332.1 hypothetical protein MF628_001957 [Paenibacillus polymyxa]
MADEYAKLLRWTALNSVRGMKATVTLPSPASSTRCGGPGNGFINYYLGMSFGKLSYECGISTAPGQADKDKWHWFSNTNDGEGFIGGTWGEFHAGSTIDIMLELNGTKLTYSVNGQPKRTYSKSFTGNLSEGRVVIAACHADYKGQTIPNPLPTWDVAHNQVTVSNIQYKNVNNSWISFNSSNSTPPSSTTKWPEGRAHHGTPQDYSLSVQPGSSLMYASLKK